jgi:SnoaL-like domain
MANGGEILMSHEAELLKLLHDRFNARDMENVLMAMDEDVIWANGMEGGHVRGREGVRRYWTRQWAMIDPHVEPVEFSIGSYGKIVVEVHQIVRDLEGNVLADQMVVTFFRSRTGWSDSSIFEGRRRRRHTSQRVYELEKNQARCSLPRPICVLHFPADANLPDCSANRLVRNADLQSRRRCSSSCQYARRILPAINELTLHAG